MKRVTIGLCAATVLSAGSAALAAECVDVIWCDSFDNYGTGLLIGQDCFVAGCPDDAAGCPTGASWQAWDDSGPNGLSEVVTDQAFSAPNSVEVKGPVPADADDLVHTYNDYDLNTGVYQYSAKVFIPSDATGANFFILLNTYSSGGTKNWSTQVSFDADAGQVISDFDDGVQNEVALVQGEWSEISVIINMDTDNQIISYNDQLVVRKVWANGTGGTTGIIDLQALDLYGNTGSPIYYDDIVLCTVAPEGACCFEDGTCTDGIDETTCLETAPYAVFEGIGSTCAGVSCPERGPNGWGLNTIEFPGGPGLDALYSGDTCYPGNPPRQNCDNFSDANDEQWVVTAAWAGTYTFGFCDQSYEGAVLSLDFDEPCGFDEGDTDATGTCFIELDMAEGQEIFMTLDGLGSTDCGPYTVSVSTRCLDIDRDPGALFLDDCPEQSSPEGICYDEDVDPCNVGCNADPEAGEEFTFTDLPGAGVYAGTFGNYLADGGTTGRRDLDWYRLELTETTDVNLSLIGQGPAMIVFWATLELTEDTCTATITTSNTTPGCQETASVSAAGQAPGVYTAIVSHDFASPDDIPCGQESYYELTVDLGGGVECQEQDGDFNNSGCVDFGDINTILATWGCTGDPCGTGEYAFECLDFDGSGEVDFAEINAILANWGAGCK